jgi:hypothetical protein
MDCTACGGIGAASTICVVVMTWLGGGMASGVWAGIFDASLALGIGAGAYAGIDASTMYVVAGVCTGITAAGVEAKCVAVVRACVLVAGTYTAGTYTVEFEPTVVVHGSAVAFTAPIALIDGNDFAASTHAVTRGKTVEKMFASRLTSPKGGGRSGMVRPTPTSTVSETLASTRVSAPRERRLSASSVVRFPNGAVELLLLPQSLPGLVDNLASSRGRFIVTKASALSLSRKSKPTGMVGLKASPRSISTSVTLTLNGSGVSVDPGKPLTPLLAMLVSSRRMLELSGI